MTDKHQDDAYRELIYFVDNPYQPWEKAELKFKISPYMAIDAIYGYLHTKESEPSGYRRDLEESYEKAVFALGVEALTPKEEMLASAFYDLGAKFSKCNYSNEERELLSDALIEHQTSELENAKEKLKRKGPTQFRPYEKIINKYVELNLKYRSYTIPACCAHIKDETGIKPSEGAFSGWKKQYKETGSAFK